MADFDVGGGQMFSASSVNTFLRCAKQWEYAYVYSYKRPPTIRQVIGIAGHEAVQANYEQKMESKEDISEEEVQAAFSDSFDQLVVGVEEGGVGEAKDSGLLTLVKYHNTVAPGIQPVYVEQEIEFAIDDIEYRGTIDLVDTYQRVRDTKFTARRPGIRQSYALAMTGYALGYRQLSGETESEVVLDYMVRTKNPYHWPIVSDGPVQQSAVDSFANILAVVATSIRQGIFAPTGLSSGACSWCGYTDICDAYQRFK